MKNKKLVKNQRGQGVMEYIILTGLIGIFCLAAVKRLGVTMDKELNDINKKVRKSIRIST
jgi:Flp pilus assembly pilin Flp